VCCLQGRGGGPVWPRALLSLVPGVSAGSAPESHAFPAPLSSLLVGQTRPKARCLAQHTGPSRITLRSLLGWRCRTWGKVLHTCCQALPEPGSRLPSRGGQSSGLRWTCMAVSVRPPSPSSLHLVSGLSVGAWQSRGLCLWTRVHTHCVPTPTACHTPQTVPGSASVWGTAPAALVLQNHRMDVIDHLVPPPCRGQGRLPPAQGAPSPIQPGPEHCQGGGSHSFSGQPGPGPHHPHSKELLSCM